MKCKLAHVTSPYLIGNAMLSTTESLQSGHQIGQLVSVCFLEVSTLYKVYKKVFLGSISYHMNIAKKASKYLFGIRYIL